MSECPHLELVGGQQRLAWECALLKGSNCHWKQHEDCPRYLTARAEAALAALADLRAVAEGMAVQIKCLLVLCESYEGDAGWKPEGCEGCIEERCGPYLALAAYGALTKEQATTTEESEDG